MPSLNYGGPSLNYGAQSFNPRHKQSQEPFAERRSPGTPLSELDLDYVKNAPSTHEDSSSVDLENALPLAPSEKGKPTARTRPLILQPVISAFSTYRQHLEEANPNETPATTPPATRATTWKSSHPPPQDDPTPPRSSRTSMSSFHAAPAKHASGGSEEELTGRGRREEREGD